MAAVRASGGGSSACDLKFLHRVRQAHEELQIEKRHWNPRFAGAPLLPKFVRKDAGMYHELLKRGTRVTSPADEGLERTSRLPPPDFPHGAEWKRDNSRGWM